MMQTRTKRFANNAMPNLDKKKKSKLVNYQFGSYLSSNFPFI